LIHKQYPNNNTYEEEKYSRATITCFKLPDMASSLKKIQVFTEIYWLFGSFKGFFRTLKGLKGFLLKVFKGFKGFTGRPVLTEPNASLVGLASDHWLIPYIAYPNKLFSSVSCQCDA
jgi:hypothetical protein